MMLFLNRIDELTRLERLSRSRDGGLAVVYGRRRVGKTRLLLEWTQRNDGVYFVADQSSAALQRRYLAHALSARPARVGREEQREGHRGARKGHAGDRRPLRQAPEKTIVGFLNYKSEFDDLKLILRMRAADALGRIRSKEGVKPLAALLDEEEPNARKEYVWSLARIGGKDAVGKLVETASKGSWGAREESMRGVAMLGDDPSAFDKFAAAEQKLFEAECKDDPDNEECKDLPGAVGKHKTKILTYKNRSVAGGECKSDGACWVKHFDSKDEGTRERAAYEIGRSGNAALIDELMKRLPEKNLDTRLAIIQGADWLIDDSKDAMAQARKGLPALEKQVADERGKTEFVKVNEDLRRLLAKLNRG